MVVTFYKTKLNKQNRCYGAEQYDNYLSTCEKLDVTLSHDIIPNQPFNIETSTGMWGYNYITYTYKGYLFGAFVDSINIQAISGTTVIYHSTDNWYFTLKNIGINNIDFHGRVMRGHVKDTDENHKPILDNTTLTAEEVFNNANLKFYDFANSILQNGNVVPTRVFNQCWFLYIYFANPSTVISRKVHQTQYRGGSTPYLSNNGVTCCYPVMFIDDAYYICDFDADGNLTKDIPISDLTNGNITAITLSKVPPHTSIYFSLNGTTIKFKDAFNLIDKLDWLNTAETGLPSKAFIPQYFAPVALGSNSFESDDGTVYFNWLMGDPIEQTDNYDTYLKSIPKFTSLVYNPFYIGGSIFNMYEKWGLPATVTISLDLSSYIIIRNNYKLDGNRKISVIQNDAIFAPDTVLDYWSRLNALQTANAGKIQENAGLNQGVNAVGGMVKSSANTLSSVGKLLGAAAGGDAGGIISGIGGLISSGTDTTTTALNLERNRENADLTAENGRIIQEVAQYQYDVGKTQSEQGTGYYNTFKLPTFISVIDNSDNYKQICTNLHRYGYNTFLQVDDVYFNHVREHFNYIKCSEIEVTGVPSDIADDISNMFLKGVHLWQDDVENFERTNYSKGEWNV